MLSTLRGFTRWLTRRQVLASDPCDSELLRVSSRGQRRPRAVEEADVEAMVSAAQVEPSGRQQMFWPVRDVALLRFLAGTGAHLFHPNARLTRGHVALVSVRLVSWLEDPAAEEGA